MGEVINIQIRFADGLIRKAVLSCQKDPKYRIHFACEGLEDANIVSRDFFECLIELRLLLEKHGCQTLCEGARYDVYPSGMARDMGGGRMAYIMHLGGQSDRNDLVDIFDYSSSEKVGKVHEQLQFRQKWIASLRK